MASKQNKDDQEYVTLRLQCRKQVVVTTYGTVDVKIPRANRRRIRDSEYKPSRFAEFLDRSNCIEWGESESSHSAEWVKGIEKLADSDQSYRCHWNADTKTWHFEFGDGAKA